MNAIAERWQKDLLLGALDRCAGFDALAPMPFREAIARIAKAVISSAAAPSGRRTMAV
jgi:hypothetical protein